MVVYVRSGNKWYGMVCDLLPSSYEGWIASGNMTSAGDIPEVRPGIFAVGTPLEEQLLCALSEYPNVNGAVVIPISMNVPSDTHTHTHTEWKSMQLVNGHVDSRLDFEGVRVVVDYLGLEIPVLWPDLVRTSRCSSSWFCACICDCECWKWASALRMEIPCVECHRQLTNGI